MIIIQNKEKEDQKQDSEEISKCSSDVVSFIESWKKTGPRRLPFVPSVIANVKTGPDTTSPYIVRFNESEKKFIPTVRLDKVETNIGVYVGYKVISNGKF